MRFYVDSCVWLDFAFERGNKLNPLHEFAFQFFRKVIVEKHKIVFSKLLVSELKQFLSEHKINNLLLSQFNNLGLAEYVKISSNQLKEARALAFSRKIPKGDALHAILARDNKTLLVSNDKHFDCLQDIVEVRTPQEII